MKKKIFFIENSFDYNFLDLNSPFIGGSEKTLINISKELCKFDEFEVKVFNNTSKPVADDRLVWTNISNISQFSNPDFLISMSDANLLLLTNAKKNYLWSHSVQSFEKFYRKKQLLPFLKRKPIVILEGDYHFKKRNFVTSFFGKRILKLAPDYEFINTPVNENTIPDQNVIFNTRSDRNLELIIKCWPEIKKKTPNAKLYINPPSNKKNNFNINGVFIRKKGDKNDLIKDLLSSRLMINPGHVGEVFCLVAEEARELCLPIVTMGIGCLYERVQHEKTGFIAKNENELIDYSNKILNDNQIYLDLKKNLNLMKSSRSYYNVAQDLLKILINEK